MEVVVVHPIRCGLDDGLDVAGVIGYVFERVLGYFGAVGVHGTEIGDEKENERAETPGPAPRSHVPEARPEAPATATELNVLGT